jgi:hypothetical protein
VVPQVGISVVIFQPCGEGSGGPGRVGSPPEVHVLQAETSSFSGAKRVRTEAKTTGSAQAPGKSRREPGPPGGTAWVWAGGKPSQAGFKGPGHRHPKGTREKVSTAAGPHRGKVRPATSGMSSPVTPFPKMKLRSHGRLSRKRFRKIPGPVVCSDFFGTGPFSSEKFHRGIPIPNLPSSKSGRVLPLFIRELHSRG